MLHLELCQSIRQVLTNSDEDPWWSRRAREWLRQERKANAFLPEDKLLLVAEPEGLRLLTFGGAKANILIARLLEASLGGRVTVDNPSIGLRAEGA